MNLNDGKVSGTAIARCYAEEVLRLDRGRGATVRDAAGRRYIDFTAGIAVNALGHGRRDLARVAAREMRRRIHVSNLFTTQPAVELAEALVASGSELGVAFDACFFGNSGTEANEAALKFARLYARACRGEGNHRLVSFTNGFHGRSMGALSVTANPAYREAFDPLLGGVEYLPYNDPEAVSKLDGSVAGVIVEPIQGEGGLDSMSPPFAAALNEHCRTHDIILIADEIQTGIGRTGRLYGSEIVGLKPDIVTLSKPLAAGLPLSATLIPKRLNDLLKPGDHGSTFGGGPVTTAVAQRVWNIVRNPRFLPKVREAGERLKAGLEELIRTHTITGDTVKGAGMLLGLPLAVAPEHAKSAAAEVMAAARKERLLILKSGTSILRIAPPLTIRPRDIDRGIARLDAALTAVEQAHPEFMAGQHEPKGIERKVAEERLQER
ncbi:MAG: aspartate aminotransferase family protein [bacterium]